MKKIIFLFLILIVALTSFAGAVCGLDENGNYVCSFEPAFPECEEKSGTLKFTVEEMLTKQKIEYFLADKVLSRKIYKKEKLVEEKEFKIKESENTEKLVKDTELFIKKYNSDENFENKKICSNVSYKIELSEDKSVYIKNGMSMPEDMESILKRLKKLAE